MITVYSKMSIAMILFFRLMSNVMTCYLDNNKLLDYSLDSAGNGQNLY